MDESDESHFATLKKCGSLQIGSNHLIDLGELMIGRLAHLLLAAALLGGCSGSIYRQRSVTGNDPVAITVDARQRVLLSQQEQRRGVSGDPSFRRFCAEPSPDVFTVLGVSGSGGGTLGLGTDKSVNAALQAAFSSSETGATIARTQTVNMLREMMFRTCERYLSGAISADEFPIVAARDQRIMVSILAIEQLTGSITPRALSIASGGSASSGMNPTDLVKALADAQAAVKASNDDVAGKTKKQTEADAPPGTCAALRQKKAAGTPALTADEANRLKACDETDAAYAQAKANHDAAKEHYDALVAASKGGLGTSSANTSGSVQFASPMERSAAVGGVANAVYKIVEHTFQQDETQLFCIRVLNPQSQSIKSDLLQRRCLAYLVTQVQVERAKLLGQRYDMSQAEIEANLYLGNESAIQTEMLGLKLHGCATDPSRTSQFLAAVSAAPTLDGGEDRFVGAIRAGAGDVEKFLRQAGPEAEARIARELSNVCGLGD